jgi:hypothetical protein
LANASTRTCEGNEGLTGFIFLTSGRCMARMRAGMVSGHTMEDTLALSRDLYDRNEDTIACGTSRR